jgi:hypothetical protein
MARLTPETVKTLARELYDYPLADDAAASVAHMVGAIAAHSRRLESLGLAGLQPPFGYPTLIAEADRVSRRR